MKSPYFCLVFLSLIILSSFSSVFSQSKDSSAVGFIYFPESGLQLVKQQIALGDPYYTEALKEVCLKADQYLREEANPVVNKKKLPPSGDKHDYLSIGPYWWPNPATTDSLPWIRRDGEVNPMTRGDDTDEQRLSHLMDALSYLTFAYYYSEKPTYAEKAIELLRIWFIDTETKVNPNVNFGQGVPGQSEGRPFGIIEWTGIAKVISAIQLLKKQQTLDPQEQQTLDTWLSEYLHWLQTSELGRLEGSRLNNHANWYDYQVLGLLLYLGRLEEAKAIAEMVKWRRIKVQIDPNGAQPRELARTKSLSYSTMNLKAMVLVGAIAEKIGIDLLHFESDDGVGLLQAAAFLSPFTSGASWPYPQVSAGGWQRVVKSRLIPSFSIMSSVYRRPMIPDIDLLKKQLPALTRLQYPPILYTKN